MSMPSRSRIFSRGRAARVRAARLVAWALCAASLPGCYTLLGSRGGGEVDEVPAAHGRKVQPADVALPAGYRIEVVAEGLTFPTAVAFDDAGGVYVTEGGYSYGEVFTTPRLLRVEPGGKTRVIASGDHPPWTGIDYRDGAFYVAQGGELGGGRIVRILPDGSIHPMVEDLPSVGDHHTNGALVGPDGMLYFAVGVATNSGVVGLDNQGIGWLRRYPQFHDIPCRDVRVLGYNFRTPNPLTPEPDDEAVTGAFSPFGTRTEAGARIPGQVPCTGAIMRVPLAGGRPELVAWGFRNPYGLAFSPDGRLYVTENGFDERGSRHVFGAGDYMYEVKQGLWYGWPDFAGAEPVYTERFRPPLHADPPPRLLADHPNAPPAPVARFGVHSSSNRFDFSRNPAFGHVGEAFVAQFGDMAPPVGKVCAPVGFEVARVDVRTGVIRSFAANRGKTRGPASWVGSGGLERPVDARFDPSGQSLYVVDFGVLAMTKEASHPVEATGVLWKITRDGAGGAK